MLNRITQGELSTCLYCLESMQSNFRDGDTSTADFESLFQKIESLADQIPSHPGDLNRYVLSIALTAEQHAHNRSINSDSEIPRDRRL